MLLYEWYEQISCLINLKMCFASNDKDDIDYNKKFKVSMVNIF